MASSPVPIRAWRTRSAKGACVYTSGHSRPPAGGSNRGRRAGTPGVDSDVLDEVVQNVGAYIMGRKMFGGGEGRWNESWKGWWGDNPPYHVPVFVLTHHPRAPLPMEGGTTFNFVTDGIESALAQA